MVFVFATVTMVNAENESLEVPGKCGELAQEVFDSAVSQGESYENAMEVSDAMYHSCRYLTYLSDYIE
ncbi:MAG: hypothetical protein HKP59_11695 [Lutibacter sp.]|uniref:hypothetical protein n=1 Tax=Lutibacter sp. TaxID=1925666 RepID=UPI0017F1DCD9|nr:hypothetical protein [Lutibacter sp.]MBT8318278.1 hypothetical protein [Lutibacter sp.]NNJ59135.1 hypothetical protein [Lutibacter sp.]